MSEPNMSLAARIATISAEIGAVSKDGKNAQQHYNFIEYAAVAAKIRELQKQYGVAIIPSIQSHSCDKLTTSKGAIGFHYILSMTFTIINTDDRTDSLEISWLGESADYGDKGINKAITAGTKYLLMRLYNISEKSDNDPDSTTPPEATDVAMDDNSVKRAARIDFASVRDTLETIDEVESLEEYWRSLGKMTPKQSSLLQKFFAKRKEEINGAN